MEALLPVAKEYGLLGLVLLGIALYVWKVHIPAQAKRDTFIENLVVDGEKKSQALITAFRDDTKSLSSGFLTALDNVERRHEANVEKLIESQNNLADAIRNGTGNGVKDRTA